MATYRQHGSGNVRRDGRVHVRRDGERRFAHVWAAMDAFGGELPKGVDVHHVDGNPQNNENSNLVICGSRKYHKLLHIRTAALDETGDPEMRKCSMCKQYDSKENMKLTWRQDEHYRHSKCVSDYDKARRAN